MPTFAGSTAGTGGDSLVDFDLVSYLSEATQQQVYAPLRKGSKYRGPVGVDQSNPIVTLARISADRKPLLSGPSGIVKADYQVDVFGPIQDDVLILGEQVRYALQGFSGEMGSTEVLNVTISNQVSTWLENEDPKLVGVYRLISEYSITYREPVRDFSAG